MDSKKSITVFIIICLLVGAAVVVTNQGVAQARSLAEGEGITVPFSWTLTDSTGRSAQDGVYAFSFSLYDAQEGGKLLWSEQQSEVKVSKGKVSVELGAVTPLPKTLAEKKDARYWLAVSVRGAAEQSFTDLLPRQSVLLSPQSPEALTCPHNHFTDNWSGTSVNWGLVVENLGTGDGIRAYSSSTSTSYAAIWAVNDSTGTAVHGYSFGGNGVVGTTDATYMSGVWGHTTNGVGVTGQSTNNFGILARGGGDGSLSDGIGDLFLDGNLGEIYAKGINGMYLYSNYDVNIRLDDDNNSTDEWFRIWNGADEEIFHVDQLGNTVAKGTKSAVVQTEDYGQRLLYAVESPEVLFEDVGTAALAASGETTVAIDPIFAETVNLSDYQVFITPLCDQPVILFVTEKTATGFTVKGVTLDGQPSSCSFDYNIVAKRLGYEEVRLESSDANTKSADGTK